MKILVVSGFLGAGKTTFIRTLAERTKKDFAVMENEYGAVNVDGDFLEQTKDLNIWELTEGCICCSMQNDFATSIQTIANTVDPEYLIVEPTGVGMLSKIIENIQKIEYERITLLEPLRFWTVRCMIVVCLNFQRSARIRSSLQAGFWFLRWNLLQRMNGAV